MSCNNCKYKACGVCNRKDDVMTVEEMREKLFDFCERRGRGIKACIGCSLNISSVESCEFDEITDEEIVSCYNYVFGFSAHTEEKPVEIEEFKEEINHPDRYKGKYERIEVMRDTFGDTAVKDFCRLNAFKYLWRSEKKNGIEDIRKAVWYLNYLIEMESKE